MESLNDVKNNDILSYNDAKAFIKENGVKTKADYFALCEKHTQLSQNPQSYYKEFAGWLDYLSVATTYYDFKTCITKLKKYQDEKMVLGAFAGLSVIAKQACAFDAKFPPYDLWQEYYHDHDMHHAVLKLNYIIKK